MTEDEMVEWHQQLDGHEFAWGLDLRQHQGTPGYDRVVGGRLRQHGDVYVTAPYYK